MSGTNKRTYRAKAKSAALGESSKGNEQVAVEFQVLTEGASHDTLIWYGYFTDATVDRTIQSLRYMGWEGDDLSNLQGIDKNEVDLVVEDETYEGQTFAKVQWVNKPGGLALKAPLSPERAQSFAAKMRERIKAIDAAGGKRATSSAPKPQQQSVPPSLAQPEPPPISDADLPF